MHCHPATAKAQPPGADAAFARIMARVQAGGVPFVLHAHPATRTIAEADHNLDFDICRIVKTIAFALRDGRLVLAALRGTRRVDYPGLAGLFGVNRRQLAALSPQAVQGRLGVAPGGVSPLLPLPEAAELVVDEDVLTIAPTLYCGTGRPDRTVEIAPADLLRLCGDSRVAPFSRAMPQEASCDMR